MFSYVDCAGGGAIGPTPPPTPTPDAPVYLQAMKLHTFSVADMMKQENQLAFRSSVAAAQNDRKGFGLQFHHVVILNVCPIPVVPEDYDAAERMQNSFVDACPLRRRRRRLVSHGGKVVGLEDGLDAPTSASHFVSRLQGNVPVPSMPPTAFRGMLATDASTSSARVAPSTVGWIAQTLRRLFGVEERLLSTNSTNTSSAVSPGPAASGGGNSTGSAAASRNGTTTTSSGRGNGTSATPAPTVSNAIFDDSSSSTMTFNSSKGCIIEYQIDYSTVWLDERDNILAWMDCQSQAAADRSACGGLKALESRKRWASSLVAEFRYYGLAQGSQATGGMVRMETGWAKYVAPVFTVAPTPASGNRRGKKSLEYIDDSELDDGMPSATKIVICAICGFALLRTTYAKVKVCLDKEKKRQVRKRKHHERALRMGWVKNAENPAEEARKAAEAAAKAKQGAAPAGGGLAGAAAAAAAAKKLHG